MAAIRNYTVRVTEEQYEEVKGLAVSVGNPKWDESYAVKMYIQRIVDGALNGQISISNLFRETVAKRGE